ncbi:Uncharacterized conserved protein, DUF433 family [Flavobacterium fryxellicola]|uniref:DUF433 domain-containing protein n=1 Tax=Flavobacterium fryxellicola TaxID=249352 RepID=A0A168AJN6_9FLAO|nr:DUF433 domain-containing protein [Flavobacterium fryxellicola]OAB31542.1 hypothetical protein FBFR_01570 [Flavobacterium fryxellicola]SHN52886.1 Uncharacterized conserved protein, DUF433 family [Flavobacterium fryxellicola]
MNPEIRSGKPCVSGTRITVLDVLSYLAAGMSMEEIISDFRALDKEKIIATLSFTAYRDKITTIAFAS